MPRVAKLRGVVRELPAGKEAGAEERILFLHIRPRETGLGQADRCSVNDDLDRGDRAEFRRRPTLEDDVALHVIERPRHINEADGGGHSVLGALEEDRKTLRPRKFREGLLL